MWLSGGDLPRALPHPPEVVTLLLNRVLQHFRRHLLEAMHPYSRAGRARLVLLGELVLQNPVGREADITLPAVNSFFPSPRPC